jgi:hypothetical protein
MADASPHIARVHDVIAEVRKQSDHARKILADSCKVLREPMPDTFLGRKTQEPFPNQDELQPPPVTAEAFCGWIA